MNYPLDLSFKIIAIAPQIAVRDAAGSLVMYVKQKAFKLKEDVTIFADEAQSRPMYRIGADRIIDFNAKYEISAASGEKLGAVRRQGMKSLWKSHYDVSDARGANVFTVREANPWVKVADHILGELPVVGMLTGYLFHPAYIVSRPNGTPMFRVTKRPALFEGKYTEAEESVALPAIVMMLLLERMRG